MKRYYSFAINFLLGINGIRFTFSGKEIDSEPSVASSRTPLKINMNSEQTNLSYFGARYCISDLGVWLSVDSLAFKSPNETRYHYCSNNPIMRVDLDELHDYTIDSDGNITLVRETDDGFDMLYTAENHANECSSEIWELCLVQH